MAGELKHAPALPVAEQLTQGEWEATDTHTVDSGQAGDLLMFDGTKIVRFPKGADGTVPTMVAGALAYAVPGTFIPVINRIDADPGTVTTDDDIVLVDSTVGPITIVLPSLAGAIKPIRIKRITADANAVTIDAWSTELIEGAADFVLPGGSMSAVVIVPDAVGGSWWVT